MDDSVKKPIIYKLNDYYILKDKIKAFILPKETIDIIDYVANLVGSPNYVKTPQFLNNDNDKKKKKKYKHNEITREDWETIRNFQATTMNEKVGIEKTIDTIKGEIMKLTDKNYTKQQNNILELIRENILIWDKEQLDSIGKCIIELSSSNIFFSKIYSSLVYEIIKRWDFIIPHFEHFKITFKNTITSLKIENYTSSENYDELCKRNRINEVIRANSIFIVNIMIIEYLEPDYVIDIIHSLLDKIKSGYEIIENSSLNEEISELLFLILESSYIYLDKNCFDDFQKIKNDIENISSMKPNHTGLSNKTIFKFMDLFDIINNT